MIFKTWITDLTKLQSIINNIKNIDAWTNGATGLLNPNVVTNLSSSINGLNLQQAKLVLSTKNLTQEQVNQVLVQSGLIASENNIQGELLQSALAQSSLTAEKQKAILTELGLINAKTGEVLASKSCTKEELLNILATKGVTGANAEAIVSDLGLSGANKKVALSFDLFTRATWSQVKAQAALLAANPITYIVSIGAAILGAVKIFDALTISFDEAVKRTKTSKEELDKLTSEISDLNQEFKTTTNRIEELLERTNSGTISLLEEDELNKLREQNGELQREIKLKEKLAEIDAKEAAENAAKSITYRTDDNPWDEEYHPEDRIEKLQNWLNSANHYQEKLAEVNQQILDIEDSATDNSYKNDATYKSLVDRQQNYQKELQKANKSISSIYTELSTEDDGLYYNGKPIEGYEDLINRLDAVYLEVELYLNDGNVEDTTEKYIETIKNKLLKSGLSEKIADSVSKGFSEEELTSIINSESIDWSQCLELEDATAVIENIKWQIASVWNADKYPISFDQAWADSFTSENDAVKELGNSLLALAAKGRLTAETFNQADSTNYFKNLGISADEAVSKINKLADESQQLSSMSGNVSKISEALGTKRDNKFVSADTLSGFDAEIRGLESWDHFQEVLGNVNSSYNDCWKAANTLASEWLNNSDFLAQLTEQNREYYASQLKAMGIENYEEILTYAYQLTTAKEALTQAGFDLSAATFDEVQALISEGEYSALAQQQIWNLVLAKQISEGLTLNTAADCENLAALAQNAGVTGEAVTLLTHLMNLYNNMANGVYGNNQHAVENARKEAERLKSQIDSLLSKSIKETPVLKPRLKPSPAVKSISDDAKTAAEEAKRTAEEAKRAAEEAARSAEEALDSFLSRQEAALNAGRISFQEYSDTVSSYLQAAFASGSLSAQKYWSAMQSFLTVKKDSYDAVVSAVTGRIDREINTLRDRQDSIAAGYQSQIDSLEKQKELLQGANEERKRQLDLQKALYDQERAHQQRTILQYSEDRGMHYIQDAQALRDAKTQVEDARLQIKIAEIEQAVTDLEEARDREKASLEHMILSLEHYRDQWSQISTAYEEAQGNQLAAMILGQNWEADILGMRTDVLAAFTDNYIRLQQQIADAAWESANAQIAAQKEAAKGTDGTKGAAQALSKKPSADGAAPKAPSSFDAPAAPSAPKRKLTISSGGGNTQKLVFARPGHTLLSFHTGLKQGPVDSHSFDDDFRLVQQVGLKANEVPAILKEGEAVATQAQIRNLAEGLRHTEGKAPADQAALTEETIITRDGLILTPIQPGDEMYELMQKYNTYLESIDGNLEKMLPPAVYEQGKQMADAVSRAANSSVVNNQNMQPVSIGDIHITCPGITSQEVARQVGDQLNQMFRGLHLDAIQRSTMR